MLPSLARVGPSESGSPSALTSGARIAVLQVLRAIAALAVGQSHVVSTAAGLGVAAAQIDFAHFRHTGAMGVDLFFAISGFIVPLTALRAGETAPRFLMRRIARIYPLWWIVVILTLGIRLIAGSATPEWLASVPWSLTLLPALDAAFIPAVYLGWSLIFEMLFYLLIVVLWGRSPQFRLWRVCGALVFLGGLGLVGGVGFPFAHAFANPILMEFALGVAIGIWWTSGRPFPRWVRVPRLAGFAAILAGCLCFLWGGYAGFPPIYELRFILDSSLSAVRLLLWGLPAALIVLGCLSLAPPCTSLAGRIAVALGDASYSIYLTSVLTQSVLARALPRVGWLPGDAQILLGVAAMALVGYGFYRTVELPLLTWSNGRIRAWFRPRPIAGSASFPAPAFVAPALEAPAYHVQTYPSGFASSSGKSATDPLATTQ